MRQTSLEEEFIKGIIEGKFWLANDIFTDSERAILQYASMITTNTLAVGPEMHEKLTSAGFDQVAILQITGIASWFNYINRMADALGIGH